MYKKRHCCCWCSESSKTFLCTGYNSRTGFHRLWRCCIQVLSIGGCKEFFPPCMYMSRYLIETMTFIASVCGMKHLPSLLFCLEKYCQSRPISWIVNSGSAPVRMCSYLLWMAQFLMCITSSSDGHVGYPRTASLRQEGEQDIGAPESWHSADVPRPKASVMSDSVCVRVYNLGLL